MSFLTTVLLIFSTDENEVERIAEVNSFRYRNIPMDLKSIDSPDPQFPWYGGTKYVVGRIYVGSFNHFDVDAFLRHIIDVSWEEPEYVQILIRNENEWNYSFYCDAGAKLVYKALEQ